MKHLDVAVAIVFHDSKVLIARRKAGSVLGGYWEFPGGKCEQGETLEDCVRRELLEELAMHVRPVVCFAPIQYQYPDRLVCLHPFLCIHDSGQPQLLACDEIFPQQPRFSKHTQAKKIHPPTTGIRRLSAQPSGSSVNRQKRRTRRHASATRFSPQLDSFPSTDTVFAHRNGQKPPGAIVKWHHATMAWLNLGFKSPWLHFCLRQK